jgi:hypothetical protein
MPVYKLQATIQSLCSRVHDTSPLVSQSKQASKKSNEIPLEEMMFKEQAALKGVLVSRYSFDCPI